MGLRLSLAVLLVCFGSAKAYAVQPVCPPATATVEVYAENLSADAALTLATSGELVDATATCAGGGAAAYAQSLTCSGFGLVHCGTLTGLRPGAWVSHLEVAVAGSDVQVQHRRSVFVAARVMPPETLVWTVYPRTFVVRDTSETTFRAAVGAVTAYTAANPGPALLTFAPSAFPGADTPQTIDLSAPAPAACTPSAALCFSASRVVVDALDGGARRGAVVLSVGTRPLSLLRIFGAQNVFRGIVFAGSRAANPVGQKDTVAFSGSGARRNRLEQCEVRGPTQGDAVSADTGAGAGSDGGDRNVVLESELTGAADKGLKVTTDAEVRLVRSCVHDNAGGGVQATLAGHVIALENVVQHDVPGASRNEIMAVGNDAAAPSTITTNGNIVRFAGGRGVSIVNSAIGLLQNDYVADNQFSGGTVESTDAGAVDAVPRATFRGVAFVCNHNAGVSGICGPNSGDDAAPCTTNADCPAPSQCTLFAFPNGLGLVQVAASGHPTPEIDAGLAAEPGRNAFVLNAKTVAGANLALKVAGSQLTAVGDQWESCGSAAACDTNAIQAHDLRLAAGAAVELGTPAGPRVGEPVLTSVSPTRPSRGDLVRVFGEHFNVIEGAKCAGQTAPDAPCSADNAAVKLANKQNEANRIRFRTADDTLLTLPAGTTALYPDAVTPTMLAFYMPFDCFAPLKLEIAKRALDGTRSTASMDFCEPLGCEDAPAGVPCDDHNACTTDDRCDEAHSCAGVPISCGGSCLTGTCDPAFGCAPKPRGTTCRTAAGACDVEERCDGVAASCPADALRAAGFECRPAAGVCDVAESCTGASPTCPVDRKSTAICRAAAGACDIAERCDGVSTSCPADAFKAGTVECRAAAGVCDLAERCTGTNPACPADRKSTTLCRAAAGVCDLAEGCDGVHDDCPLDRFQNAATVCRPAAVDDDCDVAETCTGAAAGCPNDAFRPKGTPCRACKACDAQGSCVAAPRDACRAPTAAAKAQLSITNKIAKRPVHALAWTWAAGAQTSPADFGDPSSTDYTLCVYDRAADVPEVLLSAEVPAGADCGARRCWRARGKPPGIRGYDYADREGRFGGLQAMQLRPGVRGKARIVVKARGANVTLSSPSGAQLNLPLRVQLQSRADACWESTISGAPEKNDGLVFRGKSD